ncbi:MAG: family 20 glycosylhydrolase [Cyclobacteriaceae bacterium]|nr:family 20 glycosylhydrolase [Cyclobacteriaceae bacterium SS2]
MLITSGLFSCQKTEQSLIDSNNLLPAPQKATLVGGESLDPNDIEIIYLFPGLGDNPQFAATLLKDELKSLFGKDLSVKEINSMDEISGSAIVLGIPSASESFELFSENLPAPQKDQQDAYVIDITEELVVISGAADQGLFYGVQTLIQLFEEAKWNDAAVSGMLIEDWPDMKLRWVQYNYFFHLDRYEYIKESIKKLAKYKINGVVFEFEDKFQYQSHPFVVAPNNLAPDQVKELTQFAHQYHVDIVPLVQGFGHAGYLLKHEELKHLREDPEIYQSFCPLNEETYEFIFDLFGETIDATPGVDYFHIGGDEVRIMGKCSLCKEKMEEIGDLGLYLIWLDKVREFMEERGRKLVFWDDMPLKQAGVYKTTYNKADSTFDRVWEDGEKKLNGIVNKFPQDGIFMRWNYGLARDEGNYKALEWYRDNNFNTMIATAVIGDWPLIPKYESMPENIKSFVTLGAEKQALGELCTAWGDDSGNHFEIYWFGFLESSEFAWSSKSPETVDQYWRKYVYRFFGPGHQELIPAFNNLAARVPFWDTSLMKRGNKRRVGYQHITLPNLDGLPEEGSWGKRFQPLLDTARLEKARCAEGTATIKKHISSARGNAYNLEIFASMGDFMEAYTDLVLSIEHIAAYCDKQIAASKAGKQLDDSEYTKMIQKVEAAWNGYKTTYKELEELWEESRYPKGGEDYMMNDQTIYMAGRTRDLSYLILAEQELDLVGHVKGLAR